MSNHPVVQVVINASTLVWVTSDFSPSVCESEDDPKPFSDTLTGSDAICTVDTEATPGLFNSPTESIGTTNIPLSCFAGAPVDVVYFPYARSPRESARMSPSLLPKSMLRPSYPYPPTTVDEDEDGACLDKGKGRGDSEWGKEGAKHIRSPACSLSSFEAPPASLPLPSRWRRRSATSPVSRRDQHREVRIYRFKGKVVADLGPDCDVGLDGSGRVPAGTGRWPNTSCTAPEFV